MKAIQLFSLLMAGACFGKEESTTKLILDLMEQNFTQSDFLSSTWESYQNCMELASNESDFDLAKVQETIWDGFVKWGISNGTDSDPWDGGSNWQEYNPQPMAQNDDKIDGATKILITQPCNYVSNMAFYESMFSTCFDEFHSWGTTPKRTKSSFSAAFASLGSGSAFFHGSSTGLGGTLDVVPIAFVSILAYQNMVSSLPDKYWAVTHVMPTSMQDSLSETILNGTEAVYAFGKIILDNDITVWNSMIRDMNQFWQNSYYLDFAAIVIMIFRLFLTGIVADLLVPFAVDLIFEGGDREFLLDDFDPKLRELLQGVQISIGDQLQLFTNFLAFLIKIGYAFFWQEQSLQGPWLSSPVANQIGGLIMPFVNTIADGLSDTKHWLTVRPSSGIYPGDEACRGPIAHAKWHEQAANGLLDLVDVGVYVDMLLRSGGQINSGVESDSESEGETIIDSWIKDFLESEEALCLRSENSDTPTCIAELWFGVDGWNFLKANTILCVEINTEGSLPGIVECIQSQLDSTETFSPTLQDFLTCLESGPEWFVTCMSKGSNKFWQSIATMGENTVKAEM